MSYAARFPACLLAVFVFSTAFAKSLLSQETGNGAMSVVIDARDLPRKLLNATVQIPLDASTEARKIPLWYPKWVPGSHGPGGPISNVAGVRITDQAGTLLSWTRTPGEVYRMEVDVPAETKYLQIDVRYIVRQTNREDNVVVPFFAGELP